MDQPQDQHRVRRRTVTKQQDKLLRGVMAGLGVTEAGRRAGYGTRQAAHRALESLELVLGFRLESLQHPVDKTLTHLVAMTEATKTIFCQKGGVITDQREVPDNNARFRAIHMILRLHGAFPGQQRDQPLPIETAPPRVINIEIPKDDVKELAPQPGKHGTTMPGEPD